MERSAIDDELDELFPPWEKQEIFIPKVNNASRGYEKGVPFTKLHTVKFNPNSRRHIQFCLEQKYGWKPTEFTPSGDAKIDETTLGRLPYVEAQKLARSFMLTKRISMLADGNSAWLRLVDVDGRLRHVINPQGTVTGRMSSHSPNLQQIPAVRSEFGPECRELFTVPPGYKLVGADLSGIELRVLAHFLDDDGAYAAQILEGDIHQANADAAGISRDQAKTMIYAMCYSAGNQRLGEILGKGAEEGKALRDRFYRANPAFPRLLRRVRNTVQARGHLIGLDGRKLYVRSEHGALNLLLQSAAALIAKKWLELVYDMIEAEQYPAQILSVVHDEIQIMTRGDPDYVGSDIALRAAREAGQFWKIRCDIGAEYSVGRSWRDTH